MAPCAHRSLGESIYTHLGLFGTPAAQVFAPSWLNASPPGGTSTLSFHHANVHHICVTIALEHRHPDSYAGRTRRRTRRVWPSGCRCWGKMGDRAPLGAEDPAGRLDVPAGRSEVGRTEGESTMRAAGLNAGEHLFAGLREWERTVSSTLKIPPRTLGGTPIPTLGRPDWRSTLILPSLSLAGSSASSVTSMLRAKSGLGTGEPASELLHGAESADTASSA